jgi:hypothetical protein
MCRIACLIVMYDTECLLQLLSFASSMYLDVVGLCSADWDGLIRCYDGCETWLCCLLLLKKNPMVGSY